MRLSESERVRSVRRERGIQRCHVPTRPQRARHTAVLRGRPFTLTVTTSHTHTILREEHWCAFTELAPIFLYVWPGTGWRRAVRAARRIGGRSAGPAWCVAVLYQRCVTPSTSLCRPAALCLFLSDSLRCVAPLARATRRCCSAVALECAVYHTAARCRFCVLPAATVLPPGPLRRRPVLPSAVVNGVFIGRDMVVA